jgi:hypothetical protein
VPVPVLVQALLNLNLRLQVERVPRLIQTPNLLRQVGQVSHPNPIPNLLLLAQRELPPPG